jgi:hypothetical protein
MAVLRSTPLDAGWRSLTLAGAAVWALPVPLGVGLLMLALALGQVTGLDNSGAATHPLVAIHLTGWVMLFSPVLSWVGLIPALPVAGWMLRTGRGGWANFALLGLAAGVVGSWFVPGFSSLLAAAWGMLAALAFRRLVFWLTGCSP